MLTLSTKYLNFEDSKINDAIDSIPWEELPSVEEILNFGKIVSFMITKKLGLSNSTQSQLYCLEGILHRLKIENDPKLLQFYNDNPILKGITRKYTGTWSEPCKVSLKQAENALRNINVINKLRAQHNEYQQTVFYIGEPWEPRYNGMKTNPEHWYLVRFRVQLLNSELKWVEYGVHYRFGVYSLEMLTEMYENMVYPKSRIYTFEDDPENKYVLRDIIFNCITSEVPNEDLERVEFNKMTRQQINKWEYRNIGFDTSFQ